VQDCAIDACRHTQRSLLRPSKQRKQSCICCKPRCSVHACPAMSSLSAFSAYAFITLQRPSLASCMVEEHQNVETGKTDNGRLQSELCERMAVVRAK